MMQPIHNGRKGSHVVEAEDVRIRTPTHTDPMLKAAIFRRFVSSILPLYNLFSTRGSFADSTTTIASFI
uniref:Uncharacterized protein n=1 Tax=Arundo donax TaxID=35708 RepID=A0A0A9GK18_ARUDO